MENGNSKKLIYYRPFLVLKQFHVNKPPYQIPLHLKKLGIDTTLLIGKDETNINHAFNVIETGIISSSNIGNTNISDNLREISKALKFFSSTDADCFLFQGNFPISLIIVVCLRIIFLFHSAKKKYVLKLDWDGIFSNYRLLIRIPFALILFLNSLYFNFITVETTCALKRLKTLPGLHQRMSLFPNTISDFFFETGSVSKQHTVLTVSRITRNKRLEHVITAFGEACKKVNNWNMEIVGPIQDYGYFKELEHLVNTLNLSNRVKFLGEVYGEKLKEIYLHSSIFLLLPKSESFSLARIEALASSTPVVTNLSACGERVLGSVTVQNEDPILISRKLVELMENEDLRKELADFGKKSIKSWSEILSNNLIFKDLFT